MAGKNRSEHDMCGYSMATYSQPASGSVDVMIIQNPCGLRRLRCAADCGNCGQDCHALNFKR